MSIFGENTQAGMILISAFLIMIIFAKFIRSDIPNLKILFLLAICLFLWIISYIGTFWQAGHAHNMLWDTLCVISMAATIFVIFIALFKIYMRPGY
jgi:hypothetical protein